MNRLQITLTVNSELYLKDPFSSSIGKSIVEEGLNLIEEFGFENFTFLKLAQRIETTEATIYRYFKNKHLFLIYLTNLYWSWLEYRVVIASTNIEDPIKRFYKTLHEICLIVKDSSALLPVDEVKLQQVIINESTKTYFTSQVDIENKAGYFIVYKRLVDYVSKIITEINPNYAFPQALVTTLIETVLYQRYFSKHLPKLSSDLIEDDKLEQFCKSLCSAIIHFKENEK
jgi:AcrR family transcriptional regulator